ncbi:MAG: histidinol-phosphate transaminase [Thioalkalispiraceae bacterium]|jgi:histidinol-phosphate aminotransferase
MKNWIRPEIQALSAYHVPDSSGYIKLDAMENPYHWSEALTQQWLQLLRDAELNRYPDPAASELKSRIQSSLNISADAEIILGNGSDELIQMIMMAISGPDRTVLSVEPSFVMYHMIATFLGMPYVGVPLNEDFSLNGEAILSAIQQHQPAVIFLAYPNNPTGNLFDETLIDKIIATTDALVVIDEAYYAFADKTYADKLHQYKNLLVMRTVSKMGLAGLRLGYLAGAKELINEFDKVRLPYNINVLSQLSASFALQHVVQLNNQTEQIKQDRSKVFEAMQTLEGIEVFPSQANFILFRTTDKSADEVFESLKQQKILIKNLSNSSPTLKNCLRVTIGLPAENETFLTALRAALEQD